MTYEVMQNASGQYTVNFNADGMVVSIVCASKEAAKMLAAHLDAMAQSVTVEELAF